MKYVVTGAAGFIGSQLVEYLLKEGHEVIAAVRDPGRAQSLRHLRVSLEVADVGDGRRLAEIFSGADGVFHLAALFNDPECGWDEYRAVNVEGTLNVLQAAEQAGIRRVVHCSTVGVATEAHEPPHSERTPYSPQDDKYEVSKTEAEQAALGFARGKELELVVIRPAQVYGPGDVSKLKFYKMVAGGVIVDPRNTLKHPVFIHDLCRAFLLAMQATNADGEVFIIGDSEPLPLRRMVSLVAESLGVDEPRWRLPAGPVRFTAILVEKACNALGIRPVIFGRSMDFFVKSVHFDVTKAEKVLGFRASTDVAEGVRRTALWYRSEGLI